MDNFTAFSVIEISPGRYQPSLIEVKGGQVALIRPLREAMAYKPLAYEYLQGEVRLYYAGLWKKEKVSQIVAASPKPVKKGKK